MIYTQFAATRLTHSSILSLPNNILPCAYEWWMRMCASGVRGWWIDDERIRTKKTDKKESARVSRIKREPINVIREREEESVLSILTSLFFREWAFDSAPCIFLFEHKWFAVPLFVECAHPRGIVFSICGWVLVLSPQFEFRTRHESTPDTANKKKKLGDERPNSKSRERETHTQTEISSTKNYYIWIYEKFTSFLWATDRDTITTPSHRHRWQHCSRCRRRRRRNDATSVFNGY